MKRKIQFQNKNIFNHPFSKKIDQNIILNQNENPTDNNSTDSNQKSTQEIVSFETVFFLVCAYVLFVLVRYLITERFRLFHLSDSMNAQNQVSEPESVPFVMGQPITPNEDLFKRGFDKL